MFLEDWKIKVSVLWLFKEVAMLASGVLMIMAPGAIEMIQSGEIWMGIDPTAMLLLEAIIFLVPLVMAFLTLILKDSTNRWTNIVVGVVFAGLELFGLTDPMAQTAYVVLMSLSSFVALILIVWFAWKSKEKA